VYTVQCTVFYTLYNEASNIFYEQYSIVYNVQYISDTGNARTF